MTEDELKILFDRIDHLIEAEDFDALQLLLAEVHPADIAFLFPRFDRMSQNIIFDLLDKERGSDVLMELSDHTQEKVLKDISSAKLVELVDELESDEAADVLAALEPEVAEDLLAVLPDDRRQDIVHLLTYEEDTAGGIMSTELVSVRETQTVKGAIEQIRRMAEEIEDLYTVWVVDDSGVLRGNVSLKDLIIASPSTLVKSLVNHDYISVTVDTDQEEAARMMSRYDLVVLPVVDARGRLLGRITWDDAMEVLEEETSEDLGYMSGTGEEEPSTRSVFISSRQRLPWLIIGLIGGIIAAWVMSGFVDSLAALITLTFFIPVVTAMGGNVGIQASTIVVRGLATGEISFRDTGQRILKELGVALMNGLIVASLLAVINIIWRGVTQEVFVVSFALLVVILISALVGSTVPLLLKRMDVDPAVAMGPFITITNDIIGVMIYLSIATAILM